MRSFGVVLAALLLASLPVRGQQAPAAPPPAPPPVDEKLDGYLGKWEKAMKEVTTLQAQLVRIDKSRVFNTLTQLEGEAYYMKDGTGPSTLNLALLEMRPKGKKSPEFQERYLCTGTYLYDYRPAQKELRAYELPKPKPGQVADDNFLSFLFGMKASEAKRRYAIKLEKEDQLYIYVHIEPRFDTDKADFQRARLILNKTNYLPRRLEFTQANGDDVTWDIPKLSSGVRFNRKAFDAPRTPDGWKLVPVSRESQRNPRVVRPSGK